MKLHKNHLLWKIRPICINLNKLALPSSHHQCHLSPLRFFFLNFAFGIGYIHLRHQTPLKAPPSPRRFVCPVAELSMRPQTEKPKPNSLASHVCPGKNDTNNKPPLNDSKTGGSWWWSTNPKLHARIWKGEMPKNWRYVCMKFDSPKNW